MDEKPKLENASFTFSQDSNCVDGGEGEQLTIRCESSLGIDNDEGCFYILETKQWAVESGEELQQLFDRIRKVIDNN